MRLLLDTHVFLWFVWDDPQLSAAARAAIELPANEIYLSAASYWELAIKISVNKLALTEPLERYVAKHVQNNRIAILPITITHAGRVAVLPMHHRDPFDRMLIAQADVESMPLVSADAAFDAYSVARLWLEQLSRHSRNMLLSVPHPTCLGLVPSFGYGDRLGLATPGHLKAQREFAGPIQPIFAQQSIREMSRTGRTPEGVMRDAMAALMSANFSHAWGADADHLKTPADVDATAAAGFVFFTIDPSEHVDGQADDYSPLDLAAKFAAIRGETPWLGQYERREIRVAAGPTIGFDELSLQRAAVKYGAAIRHAIALALHIDRVMTARGAPYEIELSVDETPHPTTPAEHYIIAEQCLQSGMKLVSLAPRFVGEFEKGIDFKGDLGALERSLQQHAAIARQLGPYKLSLHSGSDKLSMYPLFARATRGLFHVKTAGTSYLEALRVVARHDASLFRQIVDHARERFPTDRATYHISASLDRVPPAREVAAAPQLEQLYLNDNDGRQILHVTFGSILKHERLGPALRSVLVAEPATHAQVLTNHFARHLQALRAGM